MEIETIDEMDLVCQPKSQTCGKWFLETSTHVSVKPFRVEHTRKLGSKLGVGTEIGTISEADLVCDPKS